MIASAGTAAIGLVSALVAAPITLLLLYRFRQSVIRGMKLQGKSGGDDSPGSARGEVLFPDRARDTEGSQLTVAAVERSLVSTLVVYLLAGAAFVSAFVLAAAIEFDSYSPATIMYLISSYMTPLLFAVWIVLPRGRTRLMFAGMWVGVLAVFTGVTAIAGAPLGTLVTSLLTVSGSTALLIWLSMFRRVRAAGPIVLTIAGGAVFGVSSIIDNFASGTLALNSFAALNPKLLMPAILTVGAVVGGAAVVPVLRGLGELHERNYFSDQSLTIDIVFAWFAVAYASWDGVERSAWALTAVGAFALYKATTVIGFRLLARARAKQPNADLLLLRPFSLGRRSELLFENLSKVWLRTGAIHMIAGPDLVTATVTPSEFLVFLSGRISRRFIHNVADLRKHLEGLDLAPDPDGRHRVNQLFCRDNVWREAMRGLAARSSVVLMDLRGFTSANQGCAYELGELIRDVALERVVFAVDASTDVDYLDRIVSDIRKELPAESPNAAIAGIGSRMVTVDDTPGARTRLVEALLAGAAA